MRFISSTAAVAALSLASSIMPAMAQIQSAAGSDDGLKPNAMTYVGCYSAQGDLQDLGTYQFQTTGFCQAVCIRLGKKVMGLFDGDHCYCGDNVPTGGSKVSDSECSVACIGYNTQTCGGSKAIAVWNDGYQDGDPTGSVKVVVPSQSVTVGATAAATTTSSDTTDATTKVQQSTVFVTQSGVPVASVIYTTQTASAVPSGGVNKAVVAGGAVVGVVALAGIIGCILFYIRHKKHKQLEEERRRHEAMTSLVTSGKPPSQYSLQDQRLEPSFMFQRRQSDGSIMDNHDYSRRILKVTNPDDS